EGSARGAGALRGGVVVDREAEADAGLVEAAGLNGGRGVHVHAEVLEDFGAAAAGAGAVAVLGDEDARRGAGVRRSGRGDDESGGGGDVEGLGGAAGAAGVDDDG